MDLYAIIRQLQVEKQKLDLIIEALEKLEKRTSPEGKSSGTKRAGRRWMSADERREVSERMRRYWANRREKQ